MNKADLRKIIAERKRLLTPEEKEKRSFRLFQHLEATEVFRQSHTLLLYYSMPDEVFTHKAVERWSKEKTILLPVVKGETLELRQYTGTKDLIPCGSFHILEPKGPLYTDWKHIDLAVIPGVGFDADGNRIGRGKGFYDRLLTQLAAIKIGVCFDCQIMNEIPTEPYDCPMHAICTESGWIKGLNGK